MAEVGSLFTGMLFLILFATASIIFTAFPFNLARFLASFALGEHRDQALWHGAYRHQHGSSIARPELHRSFFAKPTLSLYSPLDLSTTLSTGSRFSS
jgi:hypothetical protein